MRGWHALAAYAAVTLAATWPLALAPGRNVAWDLGEPLVAMWALAWDCEQILAILSGRLTGAARFFDANVFHPTPHALALSEHLLPQAVQILPVYAATRNPILAYNLLLLSTFVLAGFGTFLFVRDLTRNAAAAFAAGLLFAFSALRIAHAGHLDALSAQWMPFVLFGLRRFAVSRRPLPLAAAAAALVVQNLSSTHYLFFFAPVAAAYAVWELAWQRPVRGWRTAAGLLLAAAAVAAVTIPFVLPYAALRRDLDLRRSRGETVRASADVYAYATAFPGQPFWASRVRAFPQPGVALFPGIVSIGLALAGLAWRPRRNERTAATAATPPAAGISGVVRSGSLAIGLARVAGVAGTPRRRWLAAGLLALAALHLAAAAAALLYRRVTIPLWLVEVTVSDITQMLARAALLAALALLASPPLRRWAGEWGRTHGFVAAALIAALWLSLGPVPQALGRPIALAAPYGVLFDRVPGVDLLQSPARVTAIASLMLAVLGGYGAALLWRVRIGRPLLAILCIAFLAETLVLPFPTNAQPDIVGFAPLEPRVYRPGRAPAIYDAVARQTPDAVLAELPLGRPDHDRRAMFYSIAHRRRIVNGAGLVVPPYYAQLAIATSDVVRFPQAALDGLRAAGTTHVLVHEGHYLGDLGRRTTAALLAFGALEVARDAGDVLLALP